MVRYRAIAADSSVWAYTCCPSPALEHGETTVAMRQERVHTKFGRQGEACE